MESKKKGNLILRLYEKMKYLIGILLIGFFFLACRPSRSDNYFYTKLFDFASIATDQKVTHIRIVNDTLGFLLATDQKKIITEGGTIKDQSAILFRTVDGGKTFEKQILGKGLLELISQSANTNTFYMLLGRFTEYHDAKPTEYVLLSSKNLGETWEEIFTFKNKDLTDVLFLDDNIGFVFTLHDPIGYDVETLYKTEDGGKSWKLQPINIDDFSSAIITKDRKLMGLYLGDDELSYWQMNIDSLKINKIKLQNIPNDLKIYNQIQTDPQTGFHYINLANMDTNIDYLYCLETSELIKVPSPCYEFNVYGNYIGLSSEWDKNSHVKQYHYSTDKGKTWKTETPPGLFVVNPVGLYGEGQFWMMCMDGNDIQYPIMIRTAAMEDGK